MSQFHKAIARPYRGRVTAGREPDPGGGPTRPIYAALGRTEGHDLGGVEREEAALLTLVAQRVHVGVEVELGEPVDRLCRERSVLRIGLIDDAFDIAIERHPVIRVLRVHRLDAGAAALAKMPVLCPALDGIDVHSSPIGAGFVIHEATSGYLVERSEISLDSVSCRSSFVRYLHADGTTAYQEPSDYRFTSWNSLYRALHSTIADNYFLDHEVTSIDEGADGVVLHLADSSTDHADLVVAADGFDSTVRRQVFDDVERSYGGYVGWRGTVHERDLSTETFELLSDAITYCVIPNSHIVVYPIPTPDGELKVGERLVNYVWYRNVEEGAELDELMTGTDGVRRSVSLPPGLVRQHAVDEMHEATTTLAPQLAETVLSAPDPFVQVIVDIASTSMASDRVALLGDGAFSARPHAAAGTAKAAEDGWKLVEALQAHDSIADALSAWEQTQLQLGQTLVDRCRQMGERSQFLNTWTAGDPSLAFGLYGAGD